MLSNSSDFYRIQRQLKDAEDQALKFRGRLGLSDISITDKTSSFKLITKKLNELGYKVILTRKLISTKKGGHIPSIVFYYSQDKKQGGRVFIYNGYTSSKILELLIHELIHILDLFCPMLSTNRNDGRDMYMLSEDTIERVEERTELISLAFIMPMEQFQKDLFNCSYNINKIVELYGAIRASSIIKWILLHDFFHAHYALLYIEKEDIEGTTVVKKETIYTIEAYCDDSKTFDINNILSNSSSVACKSKNKKESESGESFIDNKLYQCFCFYEKDIQQSFPTSVSTSKEIKQCDEMVVIGWSKDTYNFMEKLDYKSQT